jgi:hypothetical protein
MENRHVQKNTARLRMIIQHLGYRRTGVLRSTLCLLLLAALMSLGRYVHTSRAQNSQPPLISVRNAQNGRILTPQSESRLEVLVTDRSGRPLRDTTVLFLAPESGAGGSFKEATPAGTTFFRTRTNRSGIATTTFVANAIRGVYLVEAIVEGTEAATTFAMTNVPTRITPALSPDRARSAVREQLLVNATEDETLRVYGPVLLEPGTLVASAGEESTFFPTAPFTTDKRMWLFWVDEIPLAMFAHTTRFVLLNASDTTPDLFSEARITLEGWWPTVTLPGASEPVPLLPPSYLRTIPSASSAPAEFLEAPEEPAQNAPPDACAIIIYGPFDNDPDPGASAKKIKKVLVEKKLVRDSEENIFMPRPDRPATREDVAQFLEAAKTKNCKKLYFYYNGHGNQRNAPGVHHRAGGMHLQRGKDPTENMSYKDLAMGLEEVKPSELCVLIDDCFAGEACEWLQGRSLKGFFVSAADRDHVSYRATFGRGAKYTNAFVTCWCDKNADNNGDGTVSWQEAYDCVIATSTDPQVKEPKPKGVPIDPTAGRNFPLADVCIMKEGEKATVVLQRPPDLLGRISGTLTILNPNVATFAGVTGDQTLEISIRADEQDSGPIMICGLTQGFTTYVFMGREQDFTGQAFKGVGVIQVGGTKGQPQCVDKFCEGTFNVTFTVPPDGNPAMHPVVLTNATITIAVSDNGVFIISGNRPEISSEAKGVVLGSTCEGFALGSTTYTGIPTHVVFTHVRFEKTENAVTVRGTVKFGIDGSLPDMKPICYEFTGTRRR